MTLQRFQAIVLKLGNQCWIRHYLWLSYPNEPQVMGLDMIGPGRQIQLVKELEGAGFKFDSRFGMWTVERSND